MSAELFEYIHEVKPSLSDEKRAKLGLLLMHYITLARMPGGRVRMENILTATGKSFTRKVLGSMPLVQALAFGLKVDMTCKHDDSPIPEGLRHLCERYYIDIEACKSRHKKLENARSEMWDLVIFVRVSLAVMAALHEDTFRDLDESYYGHRPVGYKPKAKWLGLLFLWHVSNGQQIFDLRPTSAGGQDALHPLQESPSLTDIPTQYLPMFLCCLSESTVTWLTYKDA